MGAWPVRRPTHAPEITLRINAKTPPTKPLVLPVHRRHACLAGPERVKESPKPKPPRLPRRRAGCRHSVAACAPDHSRGCERIPLRHRSNRQEKNNIVIPEFSAWLTLVLEQCRAENIRNLPRQRAPTPLFPERRPREACSMPISGCHDLPLATFNLASRNNLQNKPNSAATMSLPCSRFATAQPQRRWDAPPGGGDSGYFHSACAK